MPVSPTAPGWPGTRADAAGWSTPGTRTWHRNGLTTYHILSNLPSDGVLDSVESDQALIEVAREVIGGDKRLRLHNRLGEDFIGEALGSEKYNLIFADPWPGKYSLLDEVLPMVKPGGLYVIDDMNHSGNWPDGHEEKARKLLAHLQSLKGWSFSYYTFGTDVGIGQKHPLQRPT